MNAGRGGSGSEGVSGCARWGGVKKSMGIKGVSIKGGVLVMQGAGIYTQACVGGVWT